LKRFAKLDWRDWRPFVASWHLEDIEALDAEWKLGIHDAAEYRSYWERWRAWLLANEQEYKNLDRFLSEDEEFRSLMALLHGPIRSFNAHFYIEVANTFFMRNDHKNARDWLRRLDGELLNSPHRDYYAQFVAAWFRDMK